MVTRRRPISRLEGFSDAVFAFSATLLVVSLDVPTTLGELLSDLRGFVAFGVSFAVLVALWTVHRAFFRRYGLADGWTTFLNACFLFVVLYYVYPLKFLARGLAFMFLGVTETDGRQPISSIDELGTLFLLYSLGFAALFLCVALLYRHARRRADELDLSVAERIEAKSLWRNYLIMAAAGLLSAALARLGWGLEWALPGWIYFVIGPLCWWNGFRSQRELERATRGTGSAAATVSSPAANGGSDTR